MTALRPAIGLPGLVAMGLAGGAVILGLAPVFFLGLGGGLVFDDYIVGVIRFTLVQASLSTILSHLLGLPVALALARRRFPGRGLFIRLLALPLSLPALVGVLGILAILGHNGIIGGLIEPYGLTGVLIAHVFFNFPLVARMALANLEAQPAENHRLAAQLGFSDFDLFRHCDGPALRAILPGTMLLVFLLCIASFTIVLTLGGGPAATTLEVAIYQALRFDFDPARATALALIQLGICASLALLALRFPLALPLAPPLRRASARGDGASPCARIADGLALTAGFLMLVPPLAATIASGLSARAWSSAIAPALATSLAMGLAAAILSLSLCWPLAGMAARARIGRRLAGVTALSGLVLPPAVMATGWFIVAGRLPPMPGRAVAMVVALNGLMALPFAYTILAPAMARAARANDRLCQGLGIDGFARFATIDVPTLRRPLALAFAFAAIVSLGDLTAVMLLGSQDLVTLPALIYRQMGSYRIEAAAGTALVLALLVFAILTAAERWGQSDD